MASATAAAQSLLAARFRAVRGRTLALVSPLTPEDMMVQSCPEASPVKWHLAHTAWFFESFVLRDFLPGYKPFNPDFVWLFNSYYETFASFPEKRLRSSFSRPALDEILRFRAHVDEAMDRLFEAGSASGSGFGPAPEALERIELGLNHEEQHQELILTDILHAFFTNPLRPAYQSAPNKPAEAAGLVSNSATGSAALQFVQYGGGLSEAGHTGRGFAFDNERPRHRVWLEPYSLAHRLVTCAEFAEFIADGGYRRPELWLSDGWNAVQEHGWRAPLYWTGNESDSGAGSDSSGTAGWTVFTLCGEMSLEQIANAPVSHLSFYEADAYARWAGRRLPTEFEWEASAAPPHPSCNLLDSGYLLPISVNKLTSFSQSDASAEPVAESGSRIAPGLEAGQTEAPAQMYGDCWEWTASAYLPYPGFRPLPGALGEYNGKFMSGQMVLRGGSCCTPQAHIRPSYRNFFSPATRWQFSGIRLADGSNLSPVSSSDER
jgi:ergothioneine biosynthesis protein EgtB